ncbi:hypothetical protein LCGC14_2427970 [marine sediment metagenome]|uniref:Uncharacterized protein n=1 Tax=marine sediment metagenome TaxID=412755 RepID=A0A0F9BMT5_9ZZZZ
MKDNNESNKETAAKLLEILSDWSEQYGKTYEYRCIYDNEFDNLAKCITKFFSREENS